MKNEKKRQVQIIGDVVFFSYAPVVEYSAYDEVYVWDLDKTYLDTHWQSLRDLFRASFADNYHRNNVPGTATLVNSLKQSWEQKKSDQKQFPIFFITASPPQMEKKIREKLLADEILPLGIFFKDNLRNLWPGRFWKLKQHVGYKVTALMYLRTLLKNEISQVLWGDDSETDAVIYSLYSDICARRLQGDECEKVLKAFQVTPEQIQRIFATQAQIEAMDPVEKIYINLAIDTDPEYYMKFGRRMLPSYNSLQTSLDLFQDHRLSLDHVLRVGKDLYFNYGFTIDELQRSLDDLIRRQVIGEQTFLRIFPAFVEAGLLHADYIPSIAPSKIMEDVGERVFEISGVHEPWVPERIDYFHDYR
jgi:hypothetical protein